MVLDQMLGFRMSIIRERLNWNDKIDHQMKEERLNLLKRRHCIIEGMIAAFIFSAVVVLVGVLVVVLRG
jgi:cytidylate kinase